MGSKLDLRSYLAFLAENRPREFRTVTSEISPRWGVAAAVAKLEGALRNPVLKFSNVTGCNWPIVTNVCASIPRIARSLGLSTQELETNLEEMYERPVEPVIVDSAESPVREVICTGDSVDLSILPETRHTEVETASYITAAALVAWDPDCANLNVSYHRLMVVDKNSVAVYMVPGAHLDRIVQSNASRKESTPVAAFVGSHPIWSLGLLAGGSREVSEMSMIGALLGDEDMRDDGARILANLAETTDKINEGTGLLGKLLADETMADQFQRLLNQLSRAVEDAREAAPVGTFFQVLAAPF